MQPPKIYLLEMTMRGELITISIQGDFGKLRPALVIQADVFFEIPTVTVIPFSGCLQDTPLLRLTIHPSQDNKLQKVSMS